MKLVKFSLFLLILLTACTPKPNTYEIVGTVKDALASKTVYLTEVGDTNPFDSTEIVDGKFILKGEINEPKFCRITVNKEEYTISSYIFIEQGKIFYDSEGTNTHIHGTTPLVNEYNKISTKISEISNQTAQQVSQLRKLETDSANRAITDIYQNDKENSKVFFTDIFHKNKNNLIGAYALYLLASNEYTTVDDIENLYAEAGETIKNNKAVKSIMEGMVKKGKTAVGKLFTDFTIENGNLDSTKVSFSDYIGKGKYILVDFWASWCGPCKAEIPALREIYKKYKGDNFDILGVAVWDKRENTLKSLKESDMPWNHIIDAQRIPTDIYSIKGIPHIILFAPDGTILVRDLLGTRLIEKVSEILDKVG